MAELNKNGNKSTSPKGQRTKNSKNETRSYSNGGGFGSPKTSVIDGGGYGKQKK